MGILSILINNILMEHFDTLIALLSRYTSQDGGIDREEGIRWTHLIGKPRMSDIPNRKS